MVEMMSEYEAQRERNIAANNRRLVELGLGGGLTSKREKPRPRRQRISDDPDWKPERKTRVSGCTATAATEHGRVEDSEEDFEDIPKPKRLRASKPEVESDVKVKAEPQPTDHQCITIEAAKTGRSKCRHCMLPLMQNEMRVGMESWMVGRAVMVWQHPRCFLGNTSVTIEETGRGKCKQTKENFTVGGAKISCTAHTTTSHFKPVAVAPQIRAVFALAERSVESITGFARLCAEDARALREGAPACAAAPTLEVDPTPTQAETLEQGDTAAQPPKGSVSRAKGKVCWRFAGHLCYGTLLPAQESKTHCYARTHKGNTKTLTKGAASWWTVDL